MQLQPLNNEIDSEVKLSVLVFFSSAAPCHRCRRAAKQYALLSAQSIRTHSHRIVLATGRDELVLLRSHRDPTEQRRFQQDGSRREED